MDAPAVLPVFYELMRRPDLQRTDVLVYGALCVLEDGGAPRIVDIARLTGHSENPATRTRAVRSSIQRLVAAGLVRLRRRGPKPSTYEVLGPKATCVAKETVQLRG